MPQSPQCSKCGGTMSDGFIVDKDHGGAAVAHGVEGEPKKSWFFGLKLGGTSPIEITTWRCRRCGFLESYAPEWSGSRTTGFETTDAELMVSFSRTPRSAR